MMDAEHPLVLAASASLVFVVENKAPSAKQVAALGDDLSARFSDSELIIVANGCSEATSLFLKQLTGQLPDLTVEFLAERIDHDLALLVGMENAIGDYVIAAEDVESVSAVYPELLRHAQEGMDVVLACRPAAKAATLNTLLAGLYVGLYNRLTGGSLMRARPGVRLYSRAAALYVLHSPLSEILLRSERIASGFPAVRFEAGEPSGARRRGSLRRSTGKGLRTLLRSSSAPLRLVTVAGVIGAAVALLYSLYVVYVYLFFKQVEPGWTTLSLQLSFMTLVFSSLFALLAEYIVLIQRAAGDHHRAVARELRSQLSRRAGRINVVDAQGRFQLGAVSERKD
jgi:hypothetical protein